MKKKKGKIILIIIIVIVLSILLGIFFFMSHKKIGVTKIYNLEVSGIVNSVDDNFIAKSNSKYGLIKENGLILVDFNYDAMFMDNNEYANIIFSNGNTHHIYDHKGNLLFSVEGEILTYLDVLGKKEYYLVDKKVYNAEGTEIAEVTSELQRVLGDYLVYANSAYNIKTKESIVIDRYYVLGDYVLFVNYGNGYLYDYKNNSLKYYESITRDKNHFNLNNELFIDLEGIKHIEKEKYTTTINKNYYIDYSSCNEGFILKNNRGERISNTCYFNYKTTNGGVIFLSSKRNSSMYDAVLFKNGKFSSNQTFYDIGELIGVKNGNIFNYYNTNGRNVSVECRGSVSKIDGKNYVCNNGNVKYLLNSSYHKDSSEYDDLICHEDGICIVKQDGKYGLMYENELITTITYPFIEKINNYYISNDVFSYQILVLGKYNILDLKDTNYVMYTKYENLNTGNIIKEYSLEDIKDVIYKNETLFKKYSYVVLHNSKVNGYRKELLMMFKVLADNKNNIDEYYFLNALKDLVIDKEGDIGVAAGAYANEKDHITIRLNSENVIYHEIMHFIDFRLSKDIVDRYYLCNGNVATEYEYNNYDLDYQKNCQELTIPTSKFLLEAGTEYYTAYYMTKEITAYEEGVLVLGALSYMFGEDTLKSIYFQNDSDIKLYMLLKEYLGHDQFEEFIKVCNNLIDKRIVDKSHDVSLMIKYLINIYESRYTRKWNEDIEFKFILNSIRNIYRIDNSIVDNTYLNDDSYVKKIIEEINDNSFKYNDYHGKYLLVKGKSYVVFSATKEGLIYTFVVDYDFINNKINDYKVLVL